MNMQMPWETRPSKFIEAGGSLSLTSAEIIVLENHVSTSFAIFLLSLWP